MKKGRLNEPPFFHPLEMAIRGWSRAGSLDDHNSRADRHGFW
jgi:hypothetical protein